MAQAPRTEIPLTLKLSREAGERLSRRAADTGQDIAAVASSLIEQAVSTGVETDSARQLAAIESFAAGMTAWSATHLPHGHVVDDSRESIYEGRGE